MSKESLFHGRKDYRLDPKGRIPFPAIWYEPLGLGDSNRVVVARGLSSDERYLEVFSAEGWKERMKIVYEFPEGRTRNRFVRWYISTAETVELDNHNRLRLPKTLIDYSEIKKDVVMLGSIETLQIWSKELLDDAEAVDDTDFDIVFDYMNSVRKNLKGD
jgi:MraZ protein